MPERQQRGRERFTFTNLRIEDPSPASPVQTYSPYILILKSPISFEVIVPAAEALDFVDKIQEKYDREMGKVRNRLPLHLGIVYFHKRTPLYVAMEAARKMLDRPQKPQEAWRVERVRVFNEAGEDAQENPMGDRREITFATEGGVRLRWTVSWKTGDPATPDFYYPYFVMKEGTNLESRPTYFKGVSPEDPAVYHSLVHVKDLEEGDTVWVNPSSFDFEFLDSAGRRFDVAYRPDGQRREKRVACGPRPYYLEQFAELKAIWDLVAGTNGLTTTQFKNLQSLILIKQAEWQGAVESEDDQLRFKAFVRATLANVGRSWWKGLKEEERGKLTEACCDGTFFDVLELYMVVQKEKPLKDRPSRQRTPEGIGVSG